MKSAKPSEVTLSLLSNMIGESDCEINFSHILLLTDRQISKLCKDFPDNLSANIKLSNTHLSKKVESGGFLGRFRGPLLKTGLPFKNVLEPLAKNHFTRTLT